MVPLTFQSSRAFHVHGSTVMVPMLLRCREDSKGLECVGESVLPRIVLYILF